ncbi:tail fiber protein [Bradyrhizobium sp. McL0615]|uniref:tail fiber protein n=1 Tax=Bradyrhizobium sp. McL0615 TaxID=3415673 RepID=UPI003CEE07BC
MDPAALNDGARGQMAALAKYRDDIAGVVVTGGSATAYTIFSNQGFDTFAHMHGAMICFTPHVTNGANGTSLNVDGLGVKPILPAPGVGLQGAVLIQGTPYAVTYNHTDGAFYLHGYFGNPFSVPFLGGMDYWDTVAPNSAFIFPLGQAISRTVYATAFARWGIKFGPGDGSTTFNVPNKAGKVSAMIEAAASLLTPAFFGGDSTIIGTVGGSEKNSLVIGNLPPMTPSGSVSVSNGAITINGAGSYAYMGTSGGGGAGGGGQFGIPGFNSLSASQAASSASFTGSAMGGTSAAFRTQPPTITCNYVIRVL